MDRQSRIELLAPAGKWDVLEAVIAAGADAVYLGGKQFNMRLWRSDYNFTEAELAAAVNYAHSRDVQVYVVVNNLYSEKELAPLADYLRLLVDIGVDALIVQDLGVVELCRELPRPIPLHASIQMNIHNAGSVTALAELGFTRVVISRNLPLPEIERIGRATGMEMECFLHGETCFAHTGQCYTSGLLFGESSNRGRCLKPCRWPYELVRLDNSCTSVGPDGKNLLANKDLCLLPFIPDLIQAGIASLKIEGRMRQADYLVPIVAAYRRAIDFYLRDPLGYGEFTREFIEDWSAIFSNRQRDLTSGFTWKNPGASALDPAGREPRVFSVPPVMKTLAPDHLPAKLLAPAKEAGFPDVVHLGVWVGCPEAVAEVARAGADLVYIGGDNFRGGPEWDSAAIVRGVEAGKENGVQVVLAFPGINYRREWPATEHLFELAIRLSVDGVLVGNLGLLTAARQRDLAAWTDYSLNIDNAAAARVVGEIGAVQVTADLELSLPELVDLHRSSPVPVECLIHGPLPGMVSDYCIPGAWAAGASPDDICLAPCRDHYGLRDPHGQVYPVRIDRSCRNHIYLPYDLGMYPFLPDLLRHGLDRFRIDARFYTAGVAARVTGIYRALIDKILADPEGTAVSESDWVSLNNMLPRPLGLGAFGFCQENKAEQG